MQGKYIKTNVGVMPVEDYLEIKARQYGFSSYEELREEGLCISINEDELMSYKEAKEAVKC